MDQSGKKNIAYMFPLEKNTGLESEYLLAKEVITIGRHPNNDVSIPQEAVSRHHAKVERRNDGFYLVDLNSSNGVFVNGERITEKKLKEGDILTMGDVEFGFSRKAPELREEESESETTVSFIPESEEKDPISTIVTTRPSDSTPLPLAEAGISDKEELIKANTRLATLYRLSDLLRDAMDQQTVMERVMNLIFEILPADRGVILLRADDSGLEYEPAIVKYRGDEPISQQSISISRTIVKRAAREKIAILSRDAKFDDRFKGSESIMMHDIRSAMCVPLIAKGRVVGVLHVDTHESVRAFNEADLTFLSSLGNELALSLDNLQMREKMLQQEKMAAIGQTITGVAHNIKNILQLTRGGGQLMDKSLEEGSMDNARASWEIIKRGEEKITKFIKDMLDFSRSGGVPKSFCNVNDIIKEIQESIEPELEKKNIKLILDLEESIPDRRLAEDGVYKCLMNLIINSSEAINHEEGEIRITTRLNDEDGIVIKVEDNGEGIAPDVIKKLFTSFFTTKGSNGTGLGLCTTRKIIEDQNGSVSLDSTYGEGTTFMVTFPSSETKISG